MYLTWICFILLLTCVSIFWMKVFRACKHIVVFYLSLESRSTSLLFVISLRSQSSLHSLWSTSFTFGNFHIPTPLVLLLVPQPNMEQLFPGMTIVDQLTANLTTKTRIFDSNFDFYETYHIIKSARGDHAVIWESQYYAMTHKAPFLWSRVPGTILPLRKCYRAFISENVVTVGWVEYFPVWLFFLCVFSVIQSQWVLPS